jgi:protocatechuate 3,4-dioxygenase beta subunit
MGYFVKEWTCVSGTYQEPRVIEESKTEVEATKVIFRRKCQADAAGEQRCWSIVPSGASEKADERR